MSGARFGPRSIRLQVVAVVAICVLVMVALVAALAGTGSMTAAREQLRQESLVRLDVALAAADLSGVAMPDSYTGRADLPAGLRDRGDGVYTYFDGQAMWASRLAESDREPSRSASPRDRWRSRPRPCGVRSASRPPWRSCSAARSAGCSPAP